MLKNKNITIVGSGTMGKIILSGLIKSGKTSFEKITATDRTEKAIKKVEKDFRVKVTTDNIKAAKNADIIILAIKPQEMKNVLKPLSIKEIMKRKPLIISIAAGINTKFIENIVGTSVPVIRAMPNTSCLIKKGMTVICKGQNVSPEEVNMATAIFGTLGECIELREKHMDAVTGLSASGPAFIYLIIEALVDGGVMVGLPRDVAKNLVIETVIGSTSMLKETKKHPAYLKDEVTTPAGCTISGILALEDGKIRSVLARAVQIAASRAGELGIN